MPIAVHFDGLIYRLQPHGGITRVFDNLVRELSSLSDIAVQMHLWPATGKSDWPNGITTSHIPEPCLLRPRRVFHRYNEQRRSKAVATHFHRLQPGVFHST